MSAYVGRYRGIADSLASERPIDLWVHDLSQPSTPTTLLRHPRCPRVRTRSNQSQSLARSLRISSRKALPFPRQGSIRDEKQTSFTDAADLLFVLRVLGSHQFSSEGRLFALSCAAVSEHTLQCSQCPLLVRSRYNLSWGNLAPTFIVCEKAQRCRRRLFARLLFERSNRLSVLLNV